MRFTQIPFSIWSFLSLKISHGAKSHYWLRRYLLTVEVVQGQVDYLDNMWGMGLLNDNHHFYIWRHDYRSYCMFHGFAKALVLDRIKKGLGLSSWVSISWCIYPCGGAGDICECKASQLGKAR
jgi:hypothetical protein